MRNLMMHNLRLRFELQKKNRHKTHKKKHYIIFALTHETNRKHVHALISRPWRFHPIVPHGFYEQGQYRICVGRTEMWTIFVYVCQLPEEIGLYCTGYFDLYVDSIICTSGYTLFTLYVLNDVVQPLYVSTKFASFAASHSDSHKRASDFRKSHALVYVVTPVVIFRVVRHEFVSEAWLPLYTP